ncbi:MAG: RNA-binding protein, partial [Methanobacterium sp.]|nr:RNA-binding protein [Methanobacterium sp.]
KGLPDYVSSQNLADFELNMIPSQGTQTIRTEEAVLSTLSIFNLLLNLE